MSRGSGFWLSALVAGFVACTTAAYGNEDYELGVKRFDEGDMVGAMTSLRKASNAGHVKSMVLLAEILDRSEFDEDAVVLYRKAAELGDPEGMFGLGVMTAGGEGVKKDAAAGRSWIQKAADLDLPQAVNVMAQIYMKGEMGVSEAERTSPEALQWVRRAAKQDYLPAVETLAEAYRTGELLGVAADPALAKEYLAQANKLRGLDTVKGKKKGKKTAAGQAAN